MAKQILVEVLETSGLALVESEQKLPSGVLCVLEGQIGTYDIENANKRVYPKKLWENVIINESIKSQLEAKNLFGLLDHPTDTLETSGMLVSHCMRRLWLDESTNQVMGRLDILDTPAGRIANTLARYGSLGISSRGSGEINMVESKSVVDADTYDYITHDLVIQPACVGSYPKRVMESIVRADLGTKEVQDNFEAYTEVYDKLGINLGEMCELRDNSALIESQERTTFLESKVKELTDVIEEMSASVSCPDKQKVMSFIKVLEETRNSLQDKLESALTEAVDFIEVNTELKEQNEKLALDNQKLNKKVISDKEKYERRIVRLSTTNRTEINESVNLSKQTHQEDQTKLVTAQNELKLVNSQLTDSQALANRQKMRLVQSKEATASIEDKLNKLKAQHTMLQIEHLLFIEGISQKDLKKFIKARNENWNIQTVRKYLAEYKKVIGSNNVFVEGSEITVPVSNERLQLMLRKL